MNKRVLFLGGGTMGSVTPLLAVVPYMQNWDVHFGCTKTGPEKEVFKEQGIAFTEVASPKLHRFLTWRHILLPFNLALAALQGLLLLLKFRPHVLVTAGTFIQVPIVPLAWALRIPVIIHQQDLEPGLANKLSAPFAKRITVAFEDSLKLYPKRKTLWTGNPVRDLTATTNIIALDPNYPSVLITGGGTGAQALNKLVTQELCEQANVIHLTGEGRGAPEFTHPRYFPFAFLKEEMKEALQKADIVVARAGIGTLSELASLKKPAIIIPMPNTHQEANTAFLEKHNAAIVLDQRQLTPVLFTKKVVDLLQHTQEKQQFSKAISQLTRPDAAPKYADFIEKTAK